VQQLHRRDDEEPQDGSEGGEEVMEGIVTSWPAAEDALARIEGEPDGWHLRETTEGGYPLMGSSPAERADSVARRAVIRVQAMRTHPFEGTGAYCESWGSGGRLGSPEVGYVTMRTACGYPRDTHGAPPCACSVRADYDGERITTHCQGHCPRVASGAWDACRGC
jgi:hypothetical protein